MALTKIKNTSLEDADLVALASNDGSALTGVVKTGDIGSTVQAYDATIVVDADIGTTVQAYDATIVVDADIGTTVQAYDATIVVDADIGTTVQAYDATILKDADIGTTVQAYDATIMVDADIGSTVGYLNVPKSGASKTASYTLATSDIGELIEVGSSGAITIPDATFSTGDVILIFNNTTGDVTITCSITTAYIGGTNTDEASITLATRGICNVLFISGTVCVVTGNVT